MQKSTLYNNSQQVSCSAINCLSSGINILAGGSSVPLISECKGTEPHWKHLHCTYFAWLRGSRDVIASLACVRLTGWPLGWNWRRAVLSADAGLLVYHTHTLWATVPVASTADILWGDEVCVEKEATVKLGSWEIVSLGCAWVKYPIPLINNLDYSVSRNTIAANRHTVIHMDVCTFYTLHCH